MSAIVGFAATGTDKWLKVTDNLNTSVVKEWLQKVADGAERMTVSTFDKSTYGEVRIEVKRDGATEYKVRFESKSVEDGKVYKI